MDIQFPDQIFSVSFNYNGSKLVCTARDKVTRLVDCRTGVTLLEGRCHDGAKPQQCVYLKDGRIFTTGFSKMSERQYALWKEVNLF